jgi:N6-adenosine-specific RNA methylase IME4
VKYGAILIDPPVRFDVWSEKTTTPNRRASFFYNTMGWDELAALRPYLDAVAAPDCLLFLWVCAPLVPETLDLATTGWGWTYKTTAFTWVKTTRNRNTLALNLGYWTRANAEQVWLFGRGKPTRRSKSVRQALHTSSDFLAESPAVVTCPGQHSVKPEEVATRIERLVDGPYLEMFARRRRSGWTTIGNELDGLDIRDSLARVAADEPLPALGLSLLDMEAV